jgi:hypothetical protein
LRAGKYEKLTLALDPGNKPELIDELLPFEQVEREAQPGVQIPAVTDNSGTRIISMEHPVDGREMRLPASVAGATRDAGLFRMPPRVANALAGLGVALQPGGDADAALSARHHLGELHLSLENPRYVRHAVGVVACAGTVSYADAVCIPLLRSQIIGSGNAAKYVGQNGGFQTP